ncbi:alginate export family protein [Altererythrobacter sp.]|uniref:alginate export family protein n=1 Tax=Altererythrobacter sp. TaxID=1872480 RepID=UPI003CFFC7A3
MNQTVLTPAILLAAVLCPSVAYAEADKDVTVTPYADIRYRLELVDQDGLPEDATASTLRVKAGVKLGEWNGFSALVEGEAIARVGPRDYNDTVNGRTAYPVVADPSDVLLNQAYLQYRPIEEIAVKAGRQVVNLDNQRWIGSVGWRQNDQTLDAARLTVKPGKAISADYTYAWRVNRIFGPDSPNGIWHDTNIHALHVSANPGKIGTLTGYAYWLDIPAAPAANTKTFGLRFAGNQPLGGKAKLLYAAEYARQSDHAANPADFTLDYMLVEPGISASGFTIKAGFERLEGNGTSALQTPLATLHAFNGWSDKFLNTPANGLRDLYADASYKFGQDSGVKGLTLRAVYHDFNSTRGGLNYGSEWDALIAYPLTKKITVLAKFASYNAKDFATDTKKAWFQVQAKF